MYGGVPVKSRNNKQQFGEKQCSLNELLFAGENLEIATSFKNLRVMLQLIFKNLI